MATKLRGLKLFRRLCKTCNTSSSVAAQPPLASSQVEHAHRSARAFAAQAAHDLASEGPVSPAPEQTHRQLEHQAHQSLIHSLQVALSEAHSTAETPTSPQNRTLKRKANKFLREFAPLKLVLSATDNEHSEEELRMLEKWQRQLHQECSTIDELRDKYVEADAHPEQIQHGLDLENKHGDLDKSKNYIRRDKYFEARANLKRLGKGAHSAAANHMMVKWFPALRDAIEQEQAAVSASLLSRQCRVSPLALLAQQQHALHASCIHAFNMSMANSLHCNVCCLCCSVRMGRKGWTACHMGPTYMPYPLTC